ncbi:MAG: response regulator transcription factor [Acidobacteria bacterium]|nr:response regulator transcription factor [Acidobacteriota bacterium]
MPRLRILIADDDDLIRQMVKNFLEQRPEWEVVGEATNGYEAVQKAAQLHPELAILDISMPELNGLDAARQIRSTLPKTEMIALTMYDSPEMKREAFQIGIRSYILKARLVRDLAPAVEEAARQNNNGNSH